jgi:hypothetical protein
MALSFASIHQPLNDFFLNRFGTESDSPLLFRFDKFGSVVSDQSFMDPNHPELGYLPALARENVSDLVNHAPVEAGDGANVVLSEDAIDTTYFFRLLSPAAPVLPDGATEETKQAILAAFSTSKAAALKAWSSITLESLSGLMLQYKPSLTTPENWYDMSKNEVWTSHSWQISETTAPAAPDTSNQLWRLRLSELQVEQLLAVPVEVAAGPAPPNLAERVRLVRADPGLLRGAAVRGPAIAAVDRAVFPAAAAVARPIGRAALAAQPVAVAAAPRRDFGAAVAAAADAGAFPAAAAARSTFLEEVRTLAVGERLLVNQYVGQSAPTEPVQTSSISISFEYCLVNIRRPWYVDAFTKDKSWYVPTLRKGEVTTGGAVGTLPLMPIGFLAIRKLSIEANWASEDIARATEATDFGPFHVSAEIVNSKLTHPGLQIIGWILQRMPELPPNDDPALAQD